MTLDAVLPLALLILVVGAYTAHVVYIYRLARATSGWPTTEGLVISASLGERRDGDSVRFSANVRYRYSVGGSTFESTTLSIGPGVYSYYSWAADALRGVHKGKTVDVFYDPEKPSRAVLVTGHHAENMHALIGCVVGWVAVLFLSAKVVLTSH